MNALRRLELRELRETFEFNDTDGDGALNFDEFVRMMLDLESAMSADEARIGFDEIDADHNGAIELRRVRRLVERRRRTAGLPREAIRRRHQLVRIARLERRVSRVGDDAEIRFGPGLVQVPRTAHRADHVIAALHDHARESCGCGARCAATGLRVRRSRD